MRIAIDTGGTFTDCVYVVDGELQVLKLPSTPADPSESILRAVAQIAGRDTAEIRHGTTVGTNTLLERKGARVAFVTTEGFEDTIAIGRQARPKLYDLFFQKEPPLVPEELCFGVAERVGSDGRVVRGLEQRELERLVSEIRAKKPESIAISLLFSFANPAHERAVAEALRELGVPISVSHEILPEFREYERGSTVAINAYLAPRMQAYLETLDRAISEGGSRLQVMQSSGGIIPAQVAAREPVRTILSGPAGGVVGALEVARAVEFSRILTFDMGGTSTDVALVESDGGLRTTSEFRIAGMPVAVPMLDIHTVGAGGGSIASFDRGGALKVGPESAGAEPGPICYGRGEKPTVTDANLLLGRLDAEWFLSGGMKLDEARARELFERSKGSLRSVETFAEGIIGLADLHMEKALRAISVERGRDPREFVLVSFGGAGPLHACALARALGIPKVLVPMHPGALSAYGILVSDVVRDYSRTVMLKSGDEAIGEHFKALEEIGRREIGGEGGAATGAAASGAAASGGDGGTGATATAVWSADMRYAGQGYELTVDWGDDVVERFHRLHEERYGYSDPQRQVQVVNLRVRMIAATEKAARRRFAARDGDAKSAVVKEKPLYAGGRWITGRVYDRARLKAGDRFRGPAVVVEYSATTFVAPDASASVDGLANLTIEL